MKARRFDRKRTAGDDDVVRALVPAAMTQEISRRSVLGMVGGVGAIAFTAACGAGSSSAPKTGKPDGKLESKLVIYTWGEYDDPQVLKDFTRGVGPKIELGSYTSNEEMIAKLIAGKGKSGYDIVVPSSYVVPQMIEKGLLAELDKSLIPNFKNISPAFLNQGFDPNNKYTLVKDVGISGYVYDTTKIRRELTTWADFFDAAQNEAKGSFSLLDSSGEWSAAYFNANGIDQNTSNAKDLDAYEKFMIDKVAPNIETFDNAPGSAAIPQAQRALVQCWNGDARLGILSSKDADRYKWVFPTPATNRWQDTWAIAAGAKNLDAAHAFLNNVLSPEVSLRETQYLGYDTTTIGLREAAEKAGTKRADMVFFSEEQIANTSLYEHTDAAQRLAEIETKVRAAASA